MDIIQSGRKRGCGSCGQSESYELMQFNSILPRDCIARDVLSIHKGSWGDIRKVGIMAYIFVDEKLETKR